MYRIEIVEDTHFNPRDPEMHPEIVKGFEEGEYFAYEVTVQVPPACGDQSHDWENVDSISGVLLDRDFWAGVYTPERIEAQWRPGPDVEYLTELINEMLIGHGIKE